VAQAAAEALRDRAVLEVLPAWAVRAAAVAGGDAELSNPWITRKDNMRSQTLNALAWNTRASFLLAVVCFASGLLQSAPQPKQPPASGTQKGFSSAERAAQALIQSAATFDVPALLEILGPDAGELVASQDPVEDKNRGVAFAALAREKQSVTLDPKNPARATLLVGKDDWPLPIPIVKRGSMWYFDAKAGQQEILFRRIGENELDAIRICRGFVEAQRDYAVEKHDGSPLNQYAQRIISTPGKRDGLAWQNPDGSWGGPVGETVAKALQQGYTVNGPPFHGYYFKVLKGQGPSAPLGALDFMVKDMMIGGFALAAAPAQYKVTGVETFIVSHDGIVYQKDLGPGTLDVFKGMDRYNPDKTWTRTDDEE
jgi:hypothetical protein